MANCQILARQGETKTATKFETDTRPRHYIDADKIENCYFIGIGHCFLIFWLNKPETVEKKNCDKNIVYDEQVSTFINSVCLELASLMRLRLGPRLCHH
jgi:hypothetical protein